MALTFLEIFYFRKNINTKIQVAIFQALKMAMLLPCKKFALFSLIKYMHKKRLSVLFHSLKSSIMYLVCAFLSPPTKMTMQSPRMLSFFCLFVLNDTQTRLTRR